MKYLIDTHILIWFQLNDRRLKSTIYEILVNPENQIVVSDVSIFEIAIKKKINKLEDFKASIEDILIVAKEDAFQILPISHNHLSSYDGVPLFDEHRDPFDRLILSVAISENLTVISSDEKFKLYQHLIKLIEA